MQRLREIPAGRQQLQKLALAGLDRLRPLVFQGVDDDSGSSLEQGNRVFPPAPFATYRIEPKEAREHPTVGQGHEKDGLDTFSLTFRALQVRFRRQIGHTRNRDHFWLLQPAHKPREGCPGQAPKGVDVRLDPLSTPLMCVVQDRPVTRELEHIAAIHSSNLADGMQSVLDAGIDLGRAKVDKLGRDAGNKPLGGQALLERLLRLLQLRQMLLNRAV